MPNRRRPPPRRALLTSLISLPFIVPAGFALLCLAISKYRLLPPTHADRPAEPALCALVIQNSAGVTVYQETFAYAVERGTFSDSCMASAQLLKGGFTTGLLIGVGCSPSAPNSGDVWKLFGLMNGKLNRLGKPFTTDGEFLGLIPNPPQKRGRTTLFLPDVMQFRVWTGNFRVIVPVRVDWMRGRPMPGSSGRRRRDASARRPHPDGARHGRRLGDGQPETPTTAIGDARNLIRVRSQT